MVHLISERYIITDEIPGSAGMKILFNIKNQKLRFLPQTNGDIIHIDRLILSQCFLPAPPENI